MSALLINETDSVLTITMNRPKTHNALCPESIHDLREAFENVAGRKHVRAVHLRSEGESFCAGADLHYMRKMAEDNLHANLVDAQKLFDMYHSGTQIPVPVIGEIQGAVYGGGIGLAAICDIVVANENSRFCFSEAKLGLVPAVISPFVLRKAPSARLREFMFTATPFDGAQALAMGLVDYLGPAPVMQEKIRELLKAIINNGPQAVRATKALINELEFNSLNPAAVRERTTQEISKARMSNEGQEGMRCFFDKDIPEWIRIK